MNSLNPLTLMFWSPLGVAILCGTLIGLERQLRGKAVGIRTSILICVATEMFVRLGAILGGEHTDPTRILGQVVTGVGFLGAGVILTREGVVTGVTTAAGIWVLAAIGATIGLGQFAAAVALAVVTVAILVGVELLEVRFGWLRRGAHARSDEPS